MKSRPIQTLLCLTAVFLAVLVGGALSPAQEISPGPAKDANRNPIIMKYDPQAPMGTHRVQDANGRNNIIHSTGGPSERSKRLREEVKQDKDKAWEMLSHIIIDTRSYQDDFQSSENGLETTTRTNSSD